MTHQGYPCNHCTHQMPEGGCALDFEEPGAACAGFQEKKISVAAVVGEALFGASPAKVLDLAERLAEQNEAA